MDSPYFTAIGSVALQTTWVKFYVCNPCGAIVTEVSAQVHGAWHDTVADAARRAQARDERGPLDEPLTDVQRATGTRPLTGG